jgi:amidophosphoribosyltransferase
MESDLEIILQMIASNPSKSLPQASTTMNTANGQSPSSPTSHHDNANWEARIQSFMSVCEGAYSLAILTRDAVFAVRDYLGMRPLCIGEIPIDDKKKGYIVSSETCAIDIIGGKYIREVEPGEIIRIDENGFTSFQGRPPAPSPALCVFEYVYLARPDSILEGQLVHQVREQLGRQLAIEAPAEADIVVGVPDSSLPAAIGYSIQSKIPYGSGLIKNRYVHRTFIHPDNHLRKLGISMKFNTMPAVLRGKRVVLIDDSIVRGNTIAALIKMFRNAGAKEIHVRVSSPPVKHPCFMGIDMSTHEQLVASNKTVEEIRKEVGADSLAYLSQDGMMQAVNMGLPKSPSTPVARDNNNSDGAPSSTTITGSSRHCSACFSGNYPLELDSNLDW